MIESKKYEETEYTVDNLERETVLNLFYPISIIEPRYGGSYAGGDWTAFANCYRPRDRTEAFGSDTACLSFWSSGPRHYVGDEEDQKTVYAVSGDTPEEALDKLSEAIQEDLKDENVVKVRDNSKMIGYLMEGTKFQRDMSLSKQHTETEESS